MRTPTQNALSPKCKVWIERDGHVALSDWRVDLLEKVNACGSLAEAARQLRVPYKTAWYKLKEVEAGLGQPLLVKTSGGLHGGGALLTPTGREVLRRYRQLVTGIEELIGERFARLFEELPIDADTDLRPTAGRRTSPSGVG